ncbi:MAG: alpha/beta hydrolase [Deltaproteobacteria bacterium]|nr:alpha/beta hydrolase [Deltaproteobacteria bacterium]
MLLAHEITGEGERLIALSHGILGSGHNLRGLARRLTERLPCVRALTLDLRNHGSSPGATSGAPPPHTVDACAGDLEALFGRTGSPEVVIGHSFSVKVALAWARDAKRPPRQLWLLDAPIGARDRDDDTEGARDFEALLAVIAAVPMPIASRAALEEQLRARGLPEAIVRWMTTNLRVEGAGLTWRFDLDGVRAMAASFWRTDLWPALEAVAARARVFLVRAGRGGRFSAAEQARVAAAAARGLLEVLEVPHVGHWLHTEDPEALLALLVPRIAALAAPS